MTAAIESVDVGHNHKEFRMIIKYYFIIFIQHCIYKMLYGTLQYNINNANV